MESLIKGAFLADEKCHVSDAAPIADDRSTSSLLIYSLAVIKPSPRVGMLCRVCLSSPSVPSLRGVKNVV